VICVVYVDDTLLWSPKIVWIDAAISKLQNSGMTLEIEDSVAGFLGVHIERDQSAGSIKLTQVGLIKRIIAALGVENETIVHTPTTTIPLVKDMEGEPPDGTFSYPSVFGMLGYLQSNSRPFAHDLLQTNYARSPQHLCCLCLTSLAFLLSSQSIQEFALQTTYLQRIRLHY
jgi:hypothetical protein